MNYSDEELEKALSELPRSIEPERDLRRGIWHQIDRQTHTRARWRMAAAAVLLIVASSVMTLFLSREKQARQTAGHIVPGNRVELVNDNPGALAREYSSELQQLQEILRRNRETLAPETVKILEENMRVIDKAITEAQSALASDPNSDMLVDLLRSAYQRKLELLRQAARTSSAT
ncbi:MAG TPA: hypothetical protein VM100_14700 [Longimicrobiales bacterium]|nr:hypothetical protein [Longimicrobiales bacterium]